MVLIENRSDFFREGIADCARESRKGRDFVFSESVAQSTLCHAEYQAVRKLQPGNPVRDAEQKLAAAGVPA
jgi:hypothetical protein